jgi:hypothetical protein
LFFYLGARDRFYLLIEYLQGKRTLSSVFEAKIVDPKNRLYKVYFTGYF